MTFSFPGGFGGPTRAWLGRSVSCRTDRTWRSAGGAPLLFGGSGVRIGSTTLLPPMPRGPEAVEEFRRVQDINVLGVFLGIKACAPAIRRAGGRRRLPQGHRRKGL